MFDSCTRKLDFRNIEHLACTEIRAANLTHCGLVSSILEGHSSIFNFRKKHQVRIENYDLEYNIDNLYVLLAIAKCSPNVWYYGFYAIFYMHYKLKYEYLI